MVRPKNRKQSDIDTRAKQQKNILILCKEESLGQMIAKMLQAEFRCLLVKDLDKAAKMMKTARMDAAVIDLACAKLQGIKLVGDIIYDNPSTKVITISNPEQIDKSIQIMKMGAYADLTYPVSINELCMCIKEAVYGQSVKSRPGNIIKMIHQTMLAAAFAQSGDHETALYIIDKAKKGKKR